jgi:hypothetical protein
MYIYVHRLPILLVILTAISACSTPVTGVDNPTRSATQSAIDTAPQPPSSNPGWTTRGDAAVWPDYIPEDIPVLEGKIRQVMVAPESHIRIFYEDLTKDQIDKYLRLLEQKGFHLNYQVYVQEGFPDNSEERIKKGDYDAVDITRGEYHMNIGYGEGNISYDIYTSGFPEPIPTPAGLDWPVDLVNVVPKPERCPIESAAPDSTGGYQIACRPEDDAVANDYLQALQAAGYVPRESAIQSTGGVYGKGDFDITVQQTSTLLMVISIYHRDLANTTWPAALTGIVPPPEGCPIKNVLATGGLNFMISCEGESDQLVQNYVDLLISEGFTETARMEMQNGDPVSVSLEKGNLIVQLMISSPSRFSIGISEKP